MEIILTTTAIIAISSLFVLLTSSILGFRLYLTKQRKKFNILKIKQYGGVPITETERAFLIKNKNINKSTNFFIKSRKRRKPFSLKKFKEKTKLFFVKLNPFYNYKEKIKTLENNLSNNKRSVSHLRSALNKVNMDLKQLKTKKESVVDIVKKVKKEVKKEENVSALNRFNNIGVTNQFI